MSDARSASGVQAAAQADAALTADRAETKYLLPRAGVRAFVQLAASKLAVHRFVGEGANLLPDPQNFVTSIYFDSADHEHFRAALADEEHNVKIRAREYYDLMPSLAELATDSSQIVRYQPWVWFEVKQRVEGRSRKLRFRLDKCDVPAFFRGEHAAFVRSRAATLRSRAGEDPAASTLRSRAGEDPAASTLRSRAGEDPAASTPASTEGDAGDRSELSDIVSYLRSLGAPLLPSCIVNYRRLALQDASASLRVTVDLEVSYYAAPSDLWTRSHALVRGTFGAPAFTESSALVEVKSTGPAPQWLGRELARLGVGPVSYSKFVHAARAVHG